MTRVASARGLLRPPQRRIDGLVVFQKGSEAQTSPHALRMTTRRTHMNRNTAIALVLASAAAMGNAFAGTSLAGDISVESTPFVSGVSRAEVQAQLAQYKKAGVNPWSTSYNPLRSFESTKTRAEVTAEFQAARDQVAAFTREDSGSAYLARSGVRSDAQQFAGQPRVAR
jgi:hypothetical protein